MTLARRMWLASVALAFIVVAAFTALIIAISAQREATAREARSRDVTAASLRIEKLVVDMETGLRGLTLTGERRFLEPYTEASRALPWRLDALQSLVANDPAQRRRAQQLEERIQDYIEIFAKPWSRSSRRRRRSVRARSLPTRASGTSTRFGACSPASSRRGRACRGRGRRRRRTVQPRRARRRDRNRRSAALIILFGVFLARSIGRPVRAVASGATRLAGGEWSLRLPLKGPARSESSPARSTRWRSGSSRTTRSSSRRTRSYARASG